MSDVLLLLGGLLLVLPPMFDVARFNWSTEQGGHGPIVLATGLWLIHREYSSLRSQKQPGNHFLGFGALALFLLSYVITGITGILELQVAMMYGALVSAAYLVVGGRVLRAMWFPI
jgi:hypothetical protein